MKNKWQLILLLFLIGGLTGCKLNDFTTDSTKQSTTIHKTSTPKSSTSESRSDFAEAINQLIVESNGELQGVNVEPKAGVDEIVIRLQDAFAAKPPEEQQRLCDLYQVRIADAYSRFYVPEHPGEKQPRMYYQTENGELIATTTPADPSKVELHK